MKKIIALSFLLTTTVYLNGQDLESLFDKDTEITYLGIDFSHVKIIGEFSHFFTANGKDAAEIRDVYFPAWNYLIQGEKDKYDFRWMLRKKKVYYDINMIMTANENAKVEDLKGHSTPRYSEDDIANFVGMYDPSLIRENNGIGILFVAESLDKYSQEAYFHFVAVNLKTGTIILQERLRGEPMGFGIRNYWAGAFYDVMKKIEADYYGKWRREMSKGS